MPFSDSFIRRGLTSSNGQSLIKSSIVLLSTLLVSGGLIAETLVADGNLRRVQYTGDYEDYQIPATAGEYRYLYMKAKGGDGGDARSCFGTCKHAGGGTGATLAAVFNISEISNPHFMSPGDTLRFIVGDRGESEDVVRIAKGAGGGGTGIFYKGAGLGQWETLLIAGAGGGAAATVANTSTGGTGKSSQEKGADGKNGGDKGGEFGNGGKKNSGAGLFSGSGSENEGDAEAGWPRDAPIGGQGGTNTNKDSSNGGFGVGGGGFGGYTNTGGGGGGYSGGGGGGHEGGGGGGGSWPAEEETILPVNMDVIYRSDGYNGMTSTKNPQPGYIEYRFAVFDVCEGADWCALIPDDLSINGWYATTSEPTTIEADYDTEEFLFELTSSELLTLHALDPLLFNSDGSLIEDFVAFDWDDEAIAHLQDCRRRTVTINRIYVSSTSLMGDKIYHVDGDFIQEGQKHVDMYIDETGSLVFNVTCSSERITKSLTHGDLTVNYDDDEITITVHPGGGKFSLIRG